MDMAGHPSASTDADVQPTIPLSGTLLELDDLHGANRNVKEMARIQVVEKKWDEPTCEDAPEQPLYATLRTACHVLFLFLTRFLVVFLRSLWQKIVGVLLHTVYNNFSASFDPLVAFSSRPH